MPAVVLTPSSKLSDEWKHRSRQHFLDYYWHFIIISTIKAALPALLLALYSLFAKLGMSYNKRIMIIAKSRDYITEIPTKYLLLLATE